MTETPSRMTKETFVERFGAVFEHSPWIAADAWDRGLPRDADSALGLHRALCTVLRQAGRNRQLELICAHPDLVGKLAVGGRLTEESAIEQASAGLDCCSSDEFRRFQALNDAYRAKFGFPFIMAVRGRRREEILAAFEQRMDHDPEREFEQALAQIERIALLRLQELLP